MLSVFLISWQNLTETSIRSLLTEDLKRRRLSGRHQISTDGKHLIDGLAFGRPWLRVPRDRPALELPPRKRARITYDSDDDDEDEDEEYNEEVFDEELDDQDYRPEQLLLEGPEVVETDESSLGLRVPFDDADLDDDFQDEDIDDDEEEEFDLEENSEQAHFDAEEVEEETSGDEAEEDSATLEEELRLLQADNAVVGDDTEEPTIPSASSLLDIGLTSLDDITALRAAFPLSSVTILQQELISNDRHLRRTYESLAKSNGPTMSFDEMMDKAICGFPEFSQSALLDQENTIFNGFESQESAESGFKGFGPKRVLIEEVESSDVPATEADEGDDEIIPVGLSQTTQEVIPDSEEASSSESSSEAESSSDSDSDGHESPDDESSDDSSSDNDDDEQVDEVDDPTRSSGARPYVPLDDVDAESSSDSSDSDSDSSEDGGVVMNGAAKDSSEVSSDDSSSSSDSSDSDSESEPEEVSSKPKPQARVPSPPAPNPPKQPKPAPPAVVEAAPAPPGTGLTKTQKRNARRREMSRLKKLGAEGTQPPSASEASVEESELLARKQALLDAFADETPKPVEKQQTEATEEVQPEEPLAVEKTQDATPATTDSGPRRLKVDMGAGKRMLFGALGLKPPKSKADEDKLRKDLMKDVRPLKNPRAEEVAEVADTTMEEPEEPDAWRKNISYRAVECCHEGMVLSEPPFPFVQRWDPQQQYGSMKKRKRDSQNFQDDSYYDASYYDEDTQWNEDQGGTGSNKSKKRKSKGRVEAETPDDSYGKNNEEADVELNYDDVPPKRPGSSQFTDIDDLPSLPSDVSTLPPIGIDDVKPGMVITWKQLLMSKATSWQPHVASVTGIVLSLNDDNCVDFLLAKRDREPDDREYDAYTGKRVYNKFETPTDDEDDEGEDDGRRELSWKDMVDPRLVQEAPSSGSQRIPSKIGSGVLENHKVSDKQERDEHVAEELDTQKVRAEVEADLREMAEEEANENTTLILSEQNLSTFENEPVAMISIGTDGRINSPSRQLAETSFAAMIEQPSPTVEKVSEDQPDDNPNDSMAVGSEIILDGAEIEPIIPDSMPLLDIPSHQLRASTEAQLTPLVDDSALAVPSSVSSIRSGRQPPSNYELGGSLDTEEDSVVAETTPRAHETTPTPQRPNGSVSAQSSSPFPSVDEIFHTAATSRLTQSPHKSTQQSIIRSLNLGGKQDTDYEEEMRKLDDEEDSDQSVRRNRSNRSLFPNATQPESMELPKLRSPKMERLTKPLTTKKEKPSPFQIPEGSQVITLSSSPTSANFEEDYAHDGVDDTYREGSLPKGSGWVSKRETKAVPRRETRSRGGSLPATTKAQTRRMSVPEPTASAVSQIKGRRRLTRKF